MQRALDKSVMRLGPSLEIRTGSFLVIPKLKMFMSINGHVKQVIQVAEGIFAFFQHENQCNR